MMRKAGGGSVVGYNVQIAVDDRHGLIAHHAVTQDVSDQNQLAPVAQAAKEALDTETLQVAADSGYADAEQIKHCEDAGITPFVPHPRSTNTKGDFFPKSRFVYERAAPTANLGRGACVTAPQWPALPAARRCGASRRRAAGGRS